MSTKQRFQNITANDTARLQSWVYAGEVPGKAKSVAKVEIFKQDSRFSTASNPLGLVLTETIVSRLGNPTTEIYPYPDAIKTDYWETLLAISPDIYGIGTYVDRWHFILDPDFDYSAKAAREMLTADGVSGDLQGFPGTKTVIADVSEAAITGPTGTSISLSTVIVGDTVETTGSFNADGSISSTAIRRNPTTHLSGSWMVTGTVSAIDVVAKTVTITSTSSIYYRITLRKNRIPTTGGITDGSGGISGFTFTEVTDAITARALLDVSSGDPAETITPFAPTSGFFVDPLTISGAIFTDYTDGVSPSGGIHHSYFKLTPSDNDTWSGFLDVDPVNPESYEASSLSGIYFPDDSTLLVKIDWSTALPTNSVLLPWLVDEWRIAGVDYAASNGENAWDDLIERTSPSEVLVQDLHFEVRPELIFVSPRPIIPDWEFDVQPAQIYVGSVSYISVKIRPVIDLQPELIRYHYGLISSGQMTYEIYHNGGSASAAARRISTGEVYWHEESSAHVKIDTTKSPLNRGMAGFIVFFVTLPSGEKIRSPKVYFQIIDDLRSAGSSFGSIL